MSLKFRAQTNGDAARWSDRRAREEAGKVDDVQAIHEIHHVDLKTGASVPGLQDDHAGGCIDLIRRTHASPLEIDALDDAITVLGRGLVAIAAEFDRKTAAVRSGDCDPGPGRELVREAASQRVALILSDRKTVRRSQRRPHILT